MHYDSVMRYPLVLPGTTGEMIDVLYPTEDELVRAVIGQMRLGFTPYGDPVVLTGREGGTLLAQRMVKYDLSKLEPAA